MIEKILSYLTTIPADKVMHCVCGVVLFAVGQLFGYGLLLAVIGAVSKEIYDHFHFNHTADVWDAIATIIGGILGYVIYLGY